MLKFDMTGKQSRDATAQASKVNTNLVCSPFKFPVVDHTQENIKNYHTSKTASQYLFTEGSLPHFEGVVDVPSQRSVSLLPPSRGEEPQYNVHHIQCFPEAIWGAHFLNNLLLYT